MSEAKQILVVGDLILDKYVHGQASKLSPEAPIPILEHIHEEVFPGGAANVACKVAQLGGSVTLIGVIGKDDILNKKLKEELDTSGVHCVIPKDHTRPTTFKVRYLSQNQQLLRVDQESCELISGKVEYAVMQAIKTESCNASVIIIEDYGKGVFTSKVLDTILNRTHRIIIIVDPCGADWTRYQGATLITPNLRELEVAHGHTLKTDKEIEEAARQLLTVNCISAVAITLGPRGIILVTAKGATLIPTIVTNVFDVTGAGDAVVAAYALAMDSGKNLIDATKQANKAGGAVVQQRGVGHLSQRMFNDSIKSRKTVPLDIAILEVKKLQDAGQHVVFTNGCFDLLHAGHIYALEEARKQGDFLIVGLNSNESAHRLKGKGRPVLSEIRRATILSALTVVDLVVIFDEDTPEKIIQMLHPNVLVKGNEYSEENIIGAEYVRSYGGKIVRIPRIEGSSSAIVKQIRSKQFNGRKEDEDRESLPK